jgi:hypothetical protein
MGADIENINREVFELNRIYWLVLLSTVRKMNNIKNVVYED